MAKGRKTGGRRKGSVNKRSKALSEMILSALDGVGGERYLREQAASNAPAFIALVGKLLPRDLRLGGGLVLEVNLVGSRRPPDS